MAEAAMRIDKFLWFVRIAKTRSTAQAIAEEGHVRIDGRVINRAHAAVYVGSIITMIHFGKVRVIRVEALPHRRGPPAEAAACISDPSRVVDEGTAST